MCVDEVGYLSYSNRYADLLFEVVTRRYDAHKSILLSTNVITTSSASAGVFAAVTATDRA